MVVKWLARSQNQVGVHVFAGMVTSLLMHGTEAPYVAVWSQGISKQSAFGNLREYAIETGSISNLEWKIKRNGQGTETNYTLLPTKPDTRTL